MKMPPATTPLVVLSVPALLVLKEMELTVQVRLQGKDVYVNRHYVNERLRCMIFL